MKRSWRKTGLIIGFFLICLVFSLKISSGHVFADTNIAGDVSNGGNAVTQNPRSYYAIWDNNYLSEIVTVKINYSCSGSAANEEGFTIGINGGASDDYRTACENYNLTNQQQTFNFTLTGNNANIYGYNEADIYIQGDTPSGYNGGHFSYQLTISTGSISHAASACGNPGNDISTFISQSDCNQFGAYQGGPTGPTYNFTVSCKTPDNTTYYVAWSGVDLGSLYTRADINFTLTDDTTGQVLTPSGGYGGVAKLGRVGDNNAFSFAFLGHPGDKYTWQWNNAEPVAGQEPNEIVYSLPVSENSAFYGQSCWNLTSQPTSVSPSSTNNAGTALKFTNKVTNSGPDNAKYTYSYQEDYLPNGGSPSSWTTISSTSTTGGGVAAGNSFPDGTSNNLNFPGNPPPGAEMCERIIYTNPTGPPPPIPGAVNAPGASQYACATYNPGTAPAYNAECNDISVNAGNFNAPNYASTADNPLTVPVQGTNATLNIQFRNTGSSNAVWPANQYDISNGTDKITNDIYPQSNIPPGQTDLAQAYAISHSYLNVSRTLNDAQDQFKWHVHNFSTGADIGYSCTIILKWNTASTAPIGHVDSATCDGGLQGWAFDYNVLPNSINVGVWEGGNYNTGTPVPDSPFPANVSRPDVDAMYGIGGNHGFNIDLSRYEGAQAHVFYVYALGENTNGSYDTKNPLIGIITLPACPPPIGVINSASCGDGTITGWAFDPSHPDTSIQVAVYVGGPYGGGGTQVTGSPITTNLYFDTVNSTYGIGGNHGFSFDISSLRDGNSHIYYVYALGESQNGGFDGEYPQLTGSPVATIACAPFYTSGSASLRLYDSASGNTTYENPNSYSSTDSASVAFCQGASSPNTNCLSYVGSVNPSFHPGLSMSCQAIVDGPNGTATIYGGPVNSDCSSPPGQGISYTVNPVPGPIGTIPTVDATQSYCPVLSIEYSYGVIDSSGNLYQQTGPDTVSPGCQHLYNEPYFKVYGSGVESTCSANGEIGGWNDDNGTNPTSDVNTGVGSGAQLNAIALGDIVGFASGQTGSTYNTLYPAGSGAYRGAGLTFANTNASDIDENGSMINSPKMGGNFNMVTPACDSYSPPTSGTIPLGTDTIDLGNLSTVPGSGPGGSGDYIDTYPGNITIEDSNTAGFAPGTVIKIYADSPTPVAGGQNVYIADPITYDTSMGTTWSVYNQSQSPPLVEIITNDGSIYIDPNVKQLDGLYAAQSNGGSTANIYTCSAANIDGNDWQPMQSQDLYNDCSNQLVVHGSFVASQVNLMRTYGSLRNTVNPGLDAVEDPRINQNRNGCSNAASDGQQFTCAAEVFDFSPELYLSDPDSVYTPAKSGYDSYTSLPPVL